MDGNIDYIVKVYKAYPLDSSPEFAGRISLVFQTFGRFGYYDKEWQLANTTRELGNYLNAISL